MGLDSAGFDLGSPRWAALTYLRHELDAASGERGANRFAVDVKEVVDALSVAHQPSVWIVVGQNAVLTIGTLDMDGELQRNLIALELCRQTRRLVRSYLPGGHIGREL